LPRLKSAKSGFRDKEQSTRSHAFCLASAKQLAAAEVVDGADREWLLKLIVAQPDLALEEMRRVVSK
jgi:hypothetical protein